MGPIQDKKTIVEDSRITPQMPDPSSLTTQLILREVAALKELITARHTSMEKAIDLAHEDVVRVPTDVQKAVGTLKELMETKVRYEATIDKIRFDHIQDKFSWEEKHRIEQKKDSADALAAALNAAKEAVSEQNKSNVTAITKSEANVTKQIDSIGTLFTQAISGLNDKMAQITDRQTKNESMLVGKDTGKGQVTALIIGGAGLLFGLISTIVMMIKLFNS